MEMKRRLVFVKTMKRKSKILLILLKKRSTILRGDLCLPKMVSRCRNMLPTKGNYENGFVFRFLITMTSTTIVISPIFEDKRDTKLFISEEMNAALWFLFMITAYVSRTVIVAISLVLLRLFSF